MSALGLTQQMIVVAMLMVHSATIGASINETNPPAGAILGLLLSLAMLATMVFG